MDVKTLQKHIEHLERARAGAVETIESLAAADVPVELDQTLQGRLSRIDAMTQQQMARASRARLQVELGRIDAALIRCRNGSYGICCRCDELLDPQRLVADPAAPMCVECVDELAEERRIDERKRT